MGTPVRRAVAIGLAWLALAAVTQGAGARSLRERAPATPSVALADPVACPGCWQPRLRTSWQWQLQSPPAADQLLDVRMYDVDGFETKGPLVAAMHAEGIRVVCYLSAGAWENFRPDADDFPRVVLGETNGWPGERWLDIRRLDLLRPILRARLDICDRKGFDGVEFDNVDGYQNDTGFPLTGADQLRFNVWLANQAHRRELTAFLKNDLGQIDELLPYFDAAVNEQCHQYHECGALDAFVAAGEPVFGVEYRLESGAFCPHANAHDFNFLRKRLALGDWREPCRGT
jgi:hypothetical protein